MIRIPLKLRLILLIFCFISLFTSSITWASSDSLKQLGFIPPVDIPISLSGNFGELRPGHFHAGLDIRTQGKEGLPIKSIHDGFVSRIAISQYGYGKVVYVDHPNGYTSVYAHLSKFNAPISDLVYAHQYEHKSYVFDIQVDSGKIPVKQGEIIAWSGNTGGSGGPHLHFEVRNTISETPINPLHFGFEVKDNLAPTIKNLSIYPLNENSAVNGSTKPKTYSLIKSGNVYKLNTKGLPQVKGKIGFGVEAIDKVNLSPFRNGVYKVELHKNGKLVYSHIMDSIPFHETRYINAHMDFHQAKRNKKKVQRSYLLPGNKLSIYDGLVNEGKLFFTDSGSYQMEYKIQDFEGNVSRVVFEVQSNQNQHTVVPAPSAAMNLVFGEENYFENEQLRIRIPKNALYEDGSLYLDEKPAIGRCVTPRYSINTIADPLHDYMNLGINISQIPADKRPYCVIMALTEKSSVLAAEGGQVDGDWIYVDTRSFGPYTVMLDTVSPSVQLTKAVYSLNPKSRVSMSIKDNLSGIGKYEAFIDGQWHLVEYQRNKRSGYITFEHLNLKPGQHELRIEISDGVGNKTTRTYDFTW